MLHHLPLAASPQCSVESLAYAGDITALAVAHLPPCAASVAATAVLLAGVGSQLHVFSLPSGHRCCCAAALPDAARLHGVAWLPEHPAASPGARPQLLVAVHGGRHAALLRLLGPASAAEAASGAEWQLQLLLQLPRFQHWTMDVQLSPVAAGSTAASGSATTAVHVAVGLSSNAVDVFSITLPVEPEHPGVQRVVHAEGADRCLLYSMSVLPPRQQPQVHGQSSGAADSSSDSCASGSGCNGAASRAMWLVAGGSVFLDVLVWATPACAVSGSTAAVTSAASLGSPAGSVVAPTLYRLKGHEGSIHRVRWSPCGRLLATASDDRSLRLWAVPQPAAPAADSRGANTPLASGRSRATAGHQHTAAAWAEGSSKTAVLLQPQRVLWGHTARLWDCAFDGGGAFLATVSEDCSARLYCIATGQLLCTVQGHRGRGIWHCALFEPQHAADARTLTSGTVSGDNNAAAGTEAAAAAARCCLFTGGADSSIKCWRLADWLPGPAAAQCCMLRGMPPCPADAVLGGGASYKLDLSLSLDASRPLDQQGGPAQQCNQQQASEQRQPLEQQQQQQQHADSRKEWVRCLALASATGSGRGDGSSRVRRRWRQRQRWLYVGTNRGLLHRVHLPDIAAGGEEKWVCLLKPGGSNGGRPMPLMSLALLSETPGSDTGSLSSGGRDTSSGVSDDSNGSSSSSSSGVIANGKEAAGAAERRGNEGPGFFQEEPCAQSSVWVAAIDFGGRATVLLDRVGGQGTSPTSRCSWLPYGPIPPSHIGIWWGSPSGSSSSSSSSSDSSSTAGLGSRWCFTARGGLLTLWLLPACVEAADCGSGEQQAQQEQQPKRLAEVQLPLSSQVSVLAAALLPHQPVSSDAGRQQQAALVAVGNTNGGVTLLLLLVSGATLSGRQPHTQRPAAAAKVELAALAGLAAPAAEAGAGATAQLLVLAAAPRLFERNPVRTLQVRLPPCTLQGCAAAEPAVDSAAAAAALARQLQAAEMLAAGGDGTLRSLRLPTAALTAAVAAAAAAAGAACSPAAESDRAEAAGPTARQCGVGERSQPDVPSLPRLRCVGCRRYEAVTHIDGLAEPNACEAGPRGGIVFGFHSSHFCAWDEGAEARVVQVDCGGWRRPAAADVAGGDDLALCFVRDGRLWFYRRQPSDAALLPPRCLLPPHHGLEQECIRLMHVAPANRGSKSAAAGNAVVCCITGGDDGLLRQQLLELPQQTTAAGGADGSAQRVEAGGLAGGAFGLGAHLAESVQGTAVKSLAILSLPHNSSSSSSGFDSNGTGQEWLMVAAGAKQSLVACLLTARPHSRGRQGLETLQQQQPQQQPQQQALACDHLAAKEPVVRPNRKPSCASQRLESDQRYLSVTAFLWQQQQHEQQQQSDQPGPSHVSSTDVPAKGAAAGLVDGTTVSMPPRVFAVAAASDASLSLLSAELAAQPSKEGRSSDQLGPQWNKVAALQHHEYPVLCTAYCCLQDGLVGGADGTAGGTACSSQARHIVCSGASDGSVALWDVTAAAAAWTAGAVDGGSSVDGQQQQQVQPLLALEGLHQSGVNGMAVTAAGPHSLLLVTAGDDQALAFTLLDLDPQHCPSDGDAGLPRAGNCRGCRELLRLTIPNAHSSALRSVWLGALAGLEHGDAGSAAGGVATGAVAFSVGLDQQVRCWRISLNPKSRRISLLLAGRSRPGGATPTRQHQRGTAWPLQQQQQQQQGGRQGTEQLVVPPESQLAGLTPTESGTNSAGKGRAADAQRGLDAALFRTATSSDMLEVQEAGCAFTQVVEPAALDVLPLTAAAGIKHAGVAARTSDRWLVGVAGRGTELMSWQLQQQ